MNIDWTKAPDWADKHGFAGPGQRPVWFNDGRYTYADGSQEGRDFRFSVAGGSPQGWAKEEVMVITKRPEQWSGEGLPPPDTVCELRVKAALGDWSKAHIKFASRNVVVWDWDGEPGVNGLCTSYVHSVEMRPIRTPEQIAAEEREKAIKSMAEDMAGYKAVEEPNEKMLSLSTFLHDHGYRKQVAP